MSLTLKLTSLVIRTAAKPIGNYIKRQAREHERFRKVCVGFAQGLHRVDMRLRLGLLQDPAAIDRQIAKEAAEAEAKRQKAQAPTVMTKEQAEADAKRREDDKHKIEEKVKREEKDRRPRIRPLSEAKAIDSGANFISEAFLFLVASGLIIFETFRGRRKDSNRREEVQDRLDKLEAEVEESRRLRDDAEAELGTIVDAMKKAGLSVPQRALDSLNSSSSIGKEAKPEAGKQADSRRADPKQTNPAASTKVSDDTTAKNPPSGAKS